MKVRFEPAARDDLDRIFAWIANHNPRTAAEMIAHMCSETRFADLRHPGGGKPGINLWRPPLFRFDPPRYLVLVGSQ